MLNLKNIQAKRLFNQLIAQKSQQASLGSQQKQDSKSGMEGNQIRENLKRIRTAIEEGNLATLSEEDGKWISENVYKDGALDYALKDYKAVVGVADNHPGVNDSVYRFLRDMYADLANAHVHGTPIPNFPYPEAFQTTWTTVFNKIDTLAERTILPECLGNYESLNITKDTIPQLQEVSQKLKPVTGFVLEPAASLMSPGMFLLYLKESVFPATAYIRHYSMPLYTPEPDICHELIGHAACLGVPEIADLSQAVGIATQRIANSPAAQKLAIYLITKNVLHNSFDSDANFLDQCELFNIIDDVANGINPHELGFHEVKLCQDLADSIRRLANIYWFTVEFGKIGQVGNSKVWGAGIISGFGELKYSCNYEDEGEQNKELAHTPFAEEIMINVKDMVFMNKWENVEYDITHYQTQYYLFRDLKHFRELEEYLRNWGSPKDPFKKHHTGER